jgi:hypothetical protein
MHWPGTHAPYFLTTGHASLGKTGRNAPLKPMTSIFPRIGELLVLLQISALGQDWPMFGGSSTRNVVRAGTQPPRHWEVRFERGRFGPGLNIKWMAQTGIGFSMASPVVADGFVWVGTNNENPRDPSREETAPVLMCFRESDGTFVWQYIAPVPQTRRRRRRPGHRRLWGWKASLIQGGRRRTAVGTRRQSTGVPQTSVPPGGRPKRNPGDACLS